MYIGGRGYPCRKICKSVEEVLLFLSSEFKFSTFSRTETHQIDKQNGLNEKINARKNEEINPRAERSASREEQVFSNLNHAETRMVRAGLVK